MRKRNVLLLPGVVWLLVFFAVPLLFVVETSFFKRDPYGNIIHSWNIDNYIRIFDSVYLYIFRDTLAISLVSTILCLLLAYPLAYYIARTSSHWQKVLLVLIMVPFWINFLIRTYAWVLLLRSQGIVNTVLSGLGWIDQPLSLLYTPGAVMAGMVYTLLPFMVLPIYVSLEQMDRRMLEASADLGASPLKSFWHVTLPLTKSGVAAGCILVFVSSLGMYIVPDVLGGAKSSMFSNIIQNQFLSARDWPFGSALSMVLILFSLLLIYLYYLAIRTQEKEGAP